MVRKHHQLNANESEQTPGGSEGYPGVLWPWHHKESDTT